MSVMDLLRGCVSAVPQTSWPAAFAAVLPIGVGGSLAGLRQRLEHELRLLRNEPGMPRMLRPAVVGPVEVLERGAPLPPPLCAACPGSLARYTLSSAEVLAWRGAASACTQHADTLHDSWLSAAQLHRSSSAAYAMLSVMRAGGSAAERWESRKS